MKKILIVEDDARVASALKIRIEGAGYQTALAEDAISAVSIAVSARPDLVLVDINMPAGNGFSAVEHIRARLPGPLPVVFITASKQPGLVERAGAMGANGFIEKPYDPVSLLLLLQNLLEKPISQNFAPRSMPPPAPSRLTEMLR